MLHYLAIGSVLGLSAGFAPGPLLTLVISETLRHGMRSGVKVALAPILTDLPIITITLFILARLSGFHEILGGISLLGGVFILFLGFECLRTKGVKLDLEEGRPQSLKRGIIANALSPHPYLFWFSVGAPAVTRAADRSVFAVLAFIVSFYACLVGSKIVLAVVTGKSRSFLTGGKYINTMRVLGLLLLLLAVMLFRDGLRLLGFLW